MTKKPYLVDVPVKVHIWIRPDCQKKQFEIIKEARPSILFLVSDGGRNEAEWEAIRQNRELYDNEIDWECQVYRLYEDENQGLYRMGRKSAPLVWDNVDRCIFLEDDILPSVSYFRYCAELLEKYKDDERISVICGMNHLGNYENPSADYFFARQGSIWGIATWKRTYEKYHDFKWKDDKYILDLLKQRTKKNKCFWKRIQGYASSEIYEGHVAASEFYIEFSMYGHNQLQIIPKVNLINNVGCTSDAAHASEFELLPKGIQKIFNMETYELAFPLKHPDYVIPDVEYERKRNRIMAYNLPLIAYWRKIESLLKYVTKGRWSILVKKIASKIKRLEK